MKNPYLYGYLPLLTIILYSLTFGIYVVRISLDLFSKIGIYDGMREFLSDMELRVLLLIVFSLFFFMVFSAFKLIGETIHETGMLFFSRDREGKTIHTTRGGYVIFFFGALVSVFGITSFPILIAILACTVLTYFVYIVYKLSTFMSFGGMIGFIVFEVLVWATFLSSVIYVVFKLYNGLLASLPFAV